ncbi:MAG TPA: NADH-quinone oxidoreductase subunit J [Kofleriaceae bacterium]|jgi:NADH-quinone oxidoreductase subunit J
MRTQIVTRFAAIAVLGGAVLAGCTAAPVSEPCPPPVQLKVRTQLPTATAVTCPPQAAGSTAGSGAGSGAGSAAGSSGAAGAADRIQARVTFADGRTAAVAVSPDGKAILGVTYSHTDLVESSGKGVAALFWIFALASVGGALFVVTRRNLIAAVMGMVGSFLGIAAVYMLLYAQFLAVVQMLVYAGAIMVLFVFVVMILNRPEDEPVSPSGRAGQVLGGLAILYLIIRLILILMQVEPPNLEVAMAAPLPTAQGHDWGSIAAVGTDLFGPGLFPFEAISVLLLVAVVGAIAIARPMHPGDDNDTDDGDPSGTIGRDPASTQGGAA